MGWANKLIHRLAIHKHSHNTKDQGNVLTSCVLLHLPEGPQQSLVALVALVVLGVQQDFLGIDEQTGNTGGVRRDKKTKSDNCFSSWKLINNVFSLL